MPVRYAFGALAVALALAATPARAQHEAAVAAVKDHFVQNQARYGASADDLAELVVADAYASRRSGATYVYLRQAHRGLPVVNVEAQAAFTADGRVFAPRARFVAGLAGRVNATAPSVPPASAAAQAERHLRATAHAWYEPAVIADVPGEREVPLDYFVVHDDARLVYFATEGGPVRLAWAFMVEGRDGRHVWLVRSDAATGAVLDTADLVARHGWGPPAPPGLARAPLAPATPAPLVAAGTYNVFPCESPSHCSQRRVHDPDDPTASPIGWHDDGGSAYTITRGNNVHAYEDRDGDNLPGFSPDGGPGLVFDYPFDPGLDPEDQQALSVTSLFFWMNVAHDVLWHYGFDEPAGNFQNDNFGLGGLGGDYVRAEAQEGVGSSIFLTPPDGLRPRMELSVWSVGPAFTIEAPAPIAGPYPVAGANFGATAYDLTEDVVAVVDAEGGDRGCTTPFQNADALDGRLALIQRGDCEFCLKALNAEAAGAVGLLVYNCEVGTPNCNATSFDELVTMGAGSCTDPITIPAAFVQRATGLAMRDHLPVPGVTATLTSRSERDGALDAGIVLHEFGHGVSRRLVGGPGTTSCLNNFEQPGEGWSDLLGLLFTQRPGHTGAQPRGIGTYLMGQPPDGVGIRPAPYSTDFGVNDYTYGDTVPLGAGQHHAVGFIWATIFWEATWELIGAHGVSPDLHDASGTAGNQVALQLMTEGMKLVPCGPGFVDARDAVLAADTLLYGGAHSALLWRGFARRGLGLHADQGSPNTNADNVEDFTEPSPVSVEGPELPAAYRLSRAHPNPTRGAAAFTLAVTHAQPVRVSVHDALGREVAVLHDGDLAAGTAHRFTVETSSLASGTYFVRASGASFAATERLTRLR